MTTFTEINYISQFNIQPDGCIGVRKSTDVLKDGVVISTTYWRCVLVPNDSQAAEVLNEPYYASMAQAAWTPEVIANYKAFLAEQEAKRAQQGAQA